MTHLSQQMGGLFFVFLLAVAITFVAKKRGFYHFPLPPRRYPLSFWVTLGIFVAYLATSFVVLPLYSSLVTFALTRSFDASKSLPIDLLRWLQLGSVFILFGGVLLYVAFVNKKTLRRILWGEVKERKIKKAFKDLLMGGLCWIIGYPILILVSLLSAMLSRSIWGRSGVEQDAVKLLKNTLDRPLLLSFFIFALVVMIPIIEELLFRGFLQTWLSRVIGRGWAVALTAVIFALVHFSPSQGIGNFELVFSLLVLSLYLGFIYERQQTLFAPIGLHMAFNAFTVCMLLFSSGAS